MRICFRVATLGIGAILILRLTGCAPATGASTSGPASTILVDPCDAPLIPVGSWRRFQFREYAVELLLPPGLDLEPLPLSGDTELWSDESIGLVVSIGPALSRSMVDSNLVTYPDGSVERACALRVGQQDAVLLIGRSGDATDFYATTEIEAAGRPVWISASNPSSASQQYLLRIVASAQPILDGSVILGQ